MLGVLLLGFQFASEGAACIVLRSVHACFCVCCACRMSVAPGLQSMGPHAVHTCWPATAEWLAPRSTLRVACPRDVTLCMTMLKLSVPHRMHGQAQRNLLTGCRCASPLRALLLMPKHTRACPAWRTKPLLRIALTNHRVGHAPLACRLAVSALLQRPREHEQRPHRRQPLCRLGHCHDPRGQPPSKQQPRQRDAVCKLGGCCSRGRDAATGVAAGAASGASRHQQRAWGRGLRGLCFLWACVRAMFFLVTCPPC